MIGTAPLGAHRRTTRGREVVFGLAMLLSVRSSADTSTNLPAADERNWVAERQFWSFQPPKRQAQPAVKDSAWPRQPLDFFILARIEARQLRPAPAAAPHSLLRRLTFDLTGLPPTPAEVEAFLTDPRPDAYERAVERLLASPRFGEHLASLWLPLARYAEDQAHQVGDDTTYFYPNAWRYREWVIGAFNRDLPYDQFLTFQLAADRVSSAGPDDAAALGFLGLGPKYYDRGRLAVQADEWEDRIDTVCRTMLGLTVACARCHDHKFDPITMSDYYALAGVFASTRMVNKSPDGREEKTKTPGPKMQPDTLHIVAEDQPKDLAVFLRGNADRPGPTAERRFLRLLATDDSARFTDGSGRKELAEAITNPANPLTARVIVNRLWAQFFGRPLVPTPSNLGHSGIPPTQPGLLDDLAVRLREGGWSVKALVREFVLSATYRQAANAGEEAGRGEREHIPSPTPGLTLSPASSPDALPPRTQVDPENELLGHFPRRRLSIEQWRDAVLLVTGELDPAPGRSVELDDPSNHRRTVYARISRLKLNDLLMQFDYPDANVHAEQRSVTTTAIQKLFVLNSPFMVARAKALAERVAADCRAADDASRVTIQENGKTGKRENGTAGNPSNSSRPPVFSSSRFPSGSPSAGPTPSPAQFVSRAYDLLFSRPPSAEESQLALDFLRRPATGGLTRWEQYAQLLLASNEMMYVD